MNVDEPKANVKPKRRWIYFLGAVILVLGLAAAWMKRATDPATPGATPFFIRFERVRPLAAVLADLDKKGVLRSYRAARILAVLSRTRTRLPIGTYRIGAGMSTRQVLHALENPIHQMVRLPEHLWAARLARVLDKNHVCEAGDYVRAVHDPAGIFPPPLPFKLRAATLEGYLYPDTYDLPPLIGGAAVVERQLKAFDRKVYTPLGRPKDIERIVTKASLIELEVARDDERSLVSSVIDNRLRKEDDASDRKRVPLPLRFRRMASLVFPRIIARPKGRTTSYRNLGLPPGPICSPSLKSIEAAMHPAQTDYLYYVALPDGHSLFAKTFPEHQKEYREACKAALAQRAKDWAQGHL